MKQSTIWNYRQTSKHRWTAYFYGLVSVFLAVLCIIGNGPIALALILILVAFLFFFGNQGASIDTHDKKVRHYLGLGRWRIGKWENLENYPDIVLFKQKKGLIANLDVNDVKQSFYDYEVYLASPNHFHLFMICQFQDEEKAHNEAKRLAFQLDKEWVAYNPGARYARRVLA